MVTFTKAKVTMGFQKEKGSSMKNKAKAYSLMIAIVAILLAACSSTPKDSTPPATPTGL